VNYRFVLESPGGNGFRAGWAAAKTWLDDGISPYDPAVRNEVQHSIYSRPANPEAGEFLGHFIYPLPAVLLFSPFTLIPFEIARAVWMTLIESGLLVLIFFGHRLANWLPNRSLLIGLFLFSLVWYHGARVIIMGPPSVLVAISIIGALLAIERDNDWIAGLLLASAVLQPNLSIVVVLLVCYWAISVQRWQLLYSTLGFHILVLGLSLFLLPSWPIDWIRQSIDLANIDALSSAAIIIANAFPQFRSWLMIGIPVVLGILLLWEWIQVWGKNVDWLIWTASLTIVVSMLFEPHASTEDYVLLLPIMVMLFGHWIGRWGASGKFVTWFCSGSYSSPHHLPYPNRLYCIFLFRYSAFLVFIGYVGGSLRGNMVCIIHNENSSQC
jgi:hypothetical protein